VYASCLGSVFLLAACGPLSELPQSEEPVLEVAALEGAADYAFPDDADPAVAALPFIEDELLVQSLPGADGRSVAAAIEAAGAVVLDEIPEISLLRLRIPAGHQRGIAAALIADGLIEAAHKNYILTAEATANDPFVPLQSHLDRIRASRAWDITTGDARIVIAVVDSGIEAAHPDLAGKVLDGWNVRTSSNDARDAHGHGTLGAGAAAAVSNNGTGIAGVTWNCPILPVRVADDFGRASARDAAAGLLWAANHGAKVINLSFAPLWSNSLVKSAAEAAWGRGALVVISAGNGGGTHAAVGYDQALFVGAVDADGRLAAFSDRGPFVDLVAPGTSIYSTSLAGGYRHADGTSFAAPLVAGVAALAWSRNHQLRPVTVQQLVVQSAADLGDAGRDDEFASGMVDALAAVEAAGSASFVADTRPPSLTLTQPRAGALLSGRARLSANADDDWGVADVVLSIDGVPFATDDRSPYQFVIDVAAFSTGPHELTLVATDQAGNRSEAISVGVSFSTPVAGGGSSATAIVFRKPAADSVVSGDVLIEAHVSDAQGLAVVEWWIDEQPVWTAAVSGTSSGVSYVWRGAGGAPGPHLITLQVLDAAGNRQSASLSLTRR
jgi:subtilisin family serine protease